MNNKMIRQGLAAIAIVAMAICGVLISVGSDNTLAAFGAKIDNTNNYTSIADDPCSVPNTLPEPFFHYSLAQQNAPNDGDPVPDLTSNNNNGQFLGTVFSQNVPGPCGTQNGQFYFPGPWQTPSSPWLGNEIRSGPNDLYDPDVFTVATWFRYDRTGWQDFDSSSNPLSNPDSRGGILAQFGAGQSTMSDRRSRTLYVDTDRQLKFWCDNGRRTLPLLQTGAADFTDGNWYHAAASIGPAGMRLYVNGNRVARRNTRNCGAHSGRWFFADGRSSRSGSNGWNQFEGNMKHIVYWQQQLTDAQIATLASTGP